jgi:hypothetical protein
MATIFVSQSSQDNEVAADLSRRLKENGYDSLFPDFDPDAGIKGGRHWDDPGRDLDRDQTWMPPPSWANSFLGPDLSSFSIRDMIWPRGGPAMVEWQAWPTGERPISTHSVRGASLKANPEMACLTIPPTQSR